MKRWLRLLIVTGALLATALGWLMTGARRGSARSAPLPVLRTVGAFTLTNQAGVLVSSTELVGRPWLVDLIFTRCPGPCAQLTRVMRDIARRLPADSPVGLLSITSDPGYDTPAVLAEYAARFEVNTPRWQFLTGSESEVRRLATRELLLVLQDKPEADRSSPDDLFLHSTLIVLIDRHGRLRTAVEGLEPGAVNRLLEALASVEAEG